MKPNRIGKLENQDKQGMKDPRRRSRGRPEKLQLRHFQQGNILKITFWVCTHVVTVSRAQKKCMLSCKEEARGEEMEVKDSHLFPT